ncbi:MAG: Ig-like domain-containing protein, partial [Prevotella sp.]|nr:Ig-like domain-containing protein [Prevotella sp.]
RTLYIKESDVMLTKVGKDSALTVTNTEGRTVSWSSSDKSVATVNAGKVRAVANGTCTVTVKSSDGKYSDTCNITVEIEESTEETKDETKDEAKEETKDESADGSKDDSGSDKSSGARTRNRIRR